MNDVLKKEGRKEGKKKYTIFDVILQIDVWINVQMLFIWTEHDSSVCRLKRIRSNSSIRSFVVIFFFLFVFIHFFQLRFIHTKYVRTIIIWWRPSFATRVGYSDVCVCVLVNVWI